MRPSEPYSKKELKPWLSEMWCIPPQENAAFVCQMEDVLDVYKRPYDPKRPLICMDEMPKQLLTEKCAPLPIQVGQPARQDYGYQRQGSANVFMIFEPLGGKRYVETNAHRKAVDWAHVMRFVADVLYPQAELIVLVMDQLNTHKWASFYQAFEPQEAWRLSRRFEIHYTPKHGSWLNMAEIELSALVRQCLDRRIPDQETLSAEAQAWANERNEKTVRVDWHFTTADARIRLKHLYPKIQV